MTCKMIKQAYEIYSLEGTNYNNRKTKGYAWTPEAATSICRRYPREELKTSVIHLIQIEDKWHRTHVIPISNEDIEGDLDQAPNSRIANQDYPATIVPAVFIEVKGRRRLRLSNKLEKTFGYIERLPKDALCRLTTKRDDAPPDVVFTVQELFNDPVVQRTVWDWLNFEVKVRQ